MPKITDLTQQKKNDERYNVFIDGSYRCALMLSTIVKNKLKIGDEVEEEAFLELVFQSEKEYAFQKAVNYISKKRCTEKEVFDNLAGKGFDERIGAYVVAKLKGYRYVDDEEYAKVFVESRVKDEGERRLRFELKQKGIAEEFIDRALETVDNFTENALGLGQKYMRNREKTYQTKGALYRYLASRGYTPDIIGEVCQTIFDGEESV